MLEIIPSILTNDPKELEEKLKRCEGVERVQIDIVDGRFANNKTIDPSALADLDTELKLDFHLMVKEPVNWVEKCVGGGADRIIGQVEYMRDQVEFVGKVQEVGASIGLAVDLGTDIGKLDPVILTNLDVVLVMSVAAGFGGQKFDPLAMLAVNSLDAIRARDDTPFRICVDGGITMGNIGNIGKAGVDEVAIGERIFKGNLKENIKMFRKQAYK